MTAAAPATLHPRALGWERRAVVRVVAGTGFLLVVGYLVVAPLVQLQMMAFTGGADDGFAAAFGRPEFVSAILHTVGLAAGSLLIGLVLGTLLAWASSRLPRRLRWMAVLPVLPIVVPAIASVAGWTFLLAPAPGYSSTRCFGSCLGGVT